jgi:peroxiredoxin
MSTQQALADARTDSGQSLLDLSQQHPILLVFLRHFGCTFCREALADLASNRAAIESRGPRLVLVHMADHAVAADYFARFNLPNIPHVSDPQKHLYSALGLRRGSLRQLFGLKCLVRGFKAGLIDRHLVGRLVGDGFQMPGVFLIHQGQVLNSFIHDSAADRPDYCAIASPAS